MEEQRNDPQGTRQNAGEHPQAEDRTTVWDRQERRRWPRFGFCAPEPQALRFRLMSRAPGGTPIGVRVRDISQGGLGIETVRRVVLSDPFTAELLTPRSPNPIPVDARPMWQQPRDGGQRWGVALITPWRLTDLLSALPDVAVKTQTSLVTFTLEAPTATTVSIAGDFNDWDTHNHPLVKGPSGAWQLRLALPSGRYEYQFFVEGYWHNDPTSARRTPNVFGTENDMIEVPARE